MRRNGRQLSGLSRSGWLGGWGAIVDVLFDMETRDPDHAFTLCLLAGRSDVRLRGVTVNPGSRAQIGVVRRLLARLCQAHIPVIHLSGLSIYHHLQWPWSDIDHLNKLEGFHR